MEEDYMALRLFLALALLVCSGCSACHDYTYVSFVKVPENCGGSCHREKDPRPCECSASCPCHAKHEGAK